MSKRPLYVLSNKLRRKRQPAERMKEKWIADFSKPEKSCFTIKPENAFNANLEKGSLFLGVKKKNCMAWLETVHRVYVDQIINAHFRFDNHGGYCAAGIMFRIAGEGTYYLALISSKGYFRLDAVHQNIPQTLIGWTETPNLNGSKVNLSVIVKGDHLIFLVNGKWIAETNDASIPGGHLGFALASYDAVSEEEFTCRSWLDFLLVDSRANTVAAEYQKWNDGMEISAESRLRLAESFAALDQNKAAYDQLLKAWQQREAAARSVMATYTETRTRGELLFAAQMTSRLGQYTAAEEYINACLAMDTGGVAELDVVAEKAKILSALNKYEDLAAFLPNCIKKYADIPSLYALLGHACWNLQKYKAAAAAWDKAFTLDGNNGLYKEAQALAKKRPAVTATNPAKRSKVKAKSVKLKK